MARGRPRKWDGSVIHGLLPASVPSQSQPDQWEKDLVQYIHFSSVANIEPGPACLHLYATSQACAGLDLVAIANRVDSLKSITKNNAVHALQSHRVNRLCTAFRKSKANNGGPKRKPLIPMNILLSWVVDTPNNQRDLFYQVIWFFCICTGCRPEETHTLEYNYSAKYINVKWNGRKHNPVSGANFVRFDFSLSAEPPLHIQRYLNSHTVLPKIGTRTNVSTCINSWLAKYHKRRNCVRPTLLHITSTVPRVRMDNTLRDKVDAGFLSIHVYESMMGHTIKVSDQYYRR